MSSRGRWFTTSLDEAQQRALAQSGRVLWVDIALPDEGARIFYDAEECGTPQRPSSYVLSGALRASARIYTGREPEPSPGFLRLYRGTGPREPEKGV